MKTIVAAGDLKTISIVIAPKDYGLFQYNTRVSINNNHMFSDYKNKDETVYVTYVRKMTILNNENLTDRLGRF